MAKAKTAKAVKAAKVPETVYISEADQYLFAQGTHYDIYKKLGAHQSVEDGKKGMSFAVWAPHAASVFVIGTFNSWNETANQMEKLGPGGIYKTFIPDVGLGELYKFLIITPDGRKLYKADPFANQGEVRPGTASVTTDITNFKWSDSKWIEERSAQDPEKAPVAIYECHIGSWMKHPETEDGFYNYREFADRIVEYLKKLKYTHIELMGIAEHPFDGSWGYQVTGYYAPTSRYGTPEDFAYLVNKLHRNKIGVILDWVPAHFPKDAHGLADFDGEALFEYPDPRMGEHPEWGTKVFNYAKSEVKGFLITNALYWIKEFHVDGLRVDAVASMLYLDYGRNPGEWTPNIYGTNENLDALEFLKHLNSVIKERNPGLLLVAQENGLWPELTDSVENDHLGFDYKWSGGWTKDLLEYLSKDPIERKNYHDQLTMSMLYAYCEHYILTLGSRDVGTLKDFADKLPGSEEQKNAQIREAYAYMMLHPGCKMMAPDKDMPKELEVFVKDLNNMYLAHPALYQLDDEYDGFEWVQLMKYEENVIAFMRKTEKPEETVLAVCNFAAIPYENYNVGVPFAGKYKEIFNSDDKKYGGNGVVNTRVKAAKKAECDEREYSITLKLPALGVAVFTCTPEETEKKPAAEHSQIKKSITKTRTVRKAAGKTKAAVKTAVKPVTKKVTKEAPQIVNKTEEKIPVKKDLTEKK